jgi:hypothetical protein
MHKDGSELHEIKRIYLANKAYFSLLPLFKFTDVHRATKTKLHKTIIRTTLYYGCESWTLSGRLEMAINLLKPSSNFTYHQV